MNELRVLATNPARTGQRIFVSFSSANQKKALNLCRSLEERGTACWISCRDIQPGANYQEQIVRAIETARAMVLVFSRSANASDEIKKELALASRHRIPVIAVRIENAQPTDAFAYELSTRQWIDAFAHWGKAMDALAATIERPEATQPQSKRSPARHVSRRVLVIAACLLLIGATVAGWIWFPRPHAVSAQALKVRLTDFQRLSPNLPATISDTLREELISAFGEDSIVRASTAPTPPPGHDPAYALSGTIREEAGRVKVIFRLSNERTGTTLWTNSFEDPAAELDKIPRQVAVDTSLTLRCGLFGASTYGGTLPEATMSDYLQACQNAGTEPEKALDFARKVIAAVPDFSWGWSMVEIASFNALLQRPPVDQATQFRQEGLRAADKAIALDPTNSEAFAFKSHLIPEGELVAREKLLYQAIHARTLPCGCEHHFYGDLLAEVGRLSDAAIEYKRSIDIMALNNESQLSLAQVYIALHRPDLAKEPLAAALELTGDPRAAAQVKVGLAPLTGNYAEALRLVNDPQVGAPPPIRPILSTAFEALVTQDATAKGRAIAALRSMPDQSHGSMFFNLLVALGDYTGVVDGIVAVVGSGQRMGARSWLFTLPNDGALRDQKFTLAAARLGLIDYWRKTRTRPDVCLGRSPPPFCKSI